MPIISVAGRKVIEAGSFVLERSEDTAELSFSGQPIGIRLNKAVAVPEVKDKPGGGIDILLTKRSMGETGNMAFDFPLPTGGKVRLTVTVTGLTEVAGAGNLVSYTLSAY